MKTENYNSGEVYCDLDFCSIEMQKGEYEDCTYKSCNFANADLSNIAFVECEFNDCDLSMVNLNQTALKEVRFIDCRLLGVHFNNCNDFLLSISFEGCYLNLASFYNLKLKGIKFENCNLQEADFTETRLTDSIFENCDLQGATFDKTNLEKADLSTAYNYSINPEINKVKGARFSIPGVVGLLDSYQIKLV